MAKVKFKQFNTKKSPYHDEYNGTKKPINVRLENDAIKLLDKHFKDIYEKDGMSNGIRSIIYDYLDRLCLKKQTFKHLEAVMLIPKGDNDEMEEKSQIIAVINTESDLNNIFNHDQRFYENKAIFELKNFNEGNFNYVFEMFRNSIDSCVYDTSKEDLKSFQSFKLKQAQLYPDLNLDDCYFIRFPLNNYLDNVHHGKAVHFKSWKNNHLGAYVFVDPLENIKRFVLIDWYYLSEISSQIVIDFQFAPEEFFIDCTMEANDFDFKHGDFLSDDDGNIYDALGEAFDDDFQQNKLKLMEADLEYKLNAVRRLIHND